MKVIEIKTLLATGMFTRYNNGHWFQLKLHPDIYFNVNKKWFMRSRGDLSFEQVLANISQEVGTELLFHLDLFT